MKTKIKSTKKPLKKFFIIKHRGKKKIVNAIIKE